MVAVISAHPIHQLHGLQVNWRRPSLRLYRCANAGSHRDDIGALVEATDVLDVLEIKGEWPSVGDVGVQSVRSDRETEVSNRMTVCQPARPSAEGSSARRLK
jgi:hypothetical protein